VTEQNSVQQGKQVKIEKTLIELPLLVLFDNSTYFTTHSVYTIQCWKAIFCVKFF